jgi:hypothetical protein
LEALFRKLGSLEDVPRGQLAGKMGTVIDLMTRLPVEIWFQENPRASDTKFEEDILKLVTANTLLLLDRGFYHFSFWLKFIEHRVDFITRLKKGASIQVERVFTNSYALRDFYGASRLGHRKNSLHYLTSDRSSFREYLALLLNERP